YATRYLLAATSGARDGELAALTWGDVYLDAALPYIDIFRTFTIEREQRPPKTRAGIRKIPLHAEAVSALRAWRKRGWMLKLKKGRHAKDTDPVFPNASGGHYRPIMGKALRKHLALAGCPIEYAGENITFHALRRSFATWLAEADVDLGVRKTLLGHAGRDVTDGHYTAKTLGRLADAVQQIELNLTTAEVVELPLRRVASSDEPEPDPSGGGPFREHKPSCFPSVFPRSAGSPAGNQTTTPANSTVNSPVCRLRRGRDSNSRITVLQTAA
ncbi:MAG: hypothetical protein RJA70_2884, partial [Pseudomonadota bacterium]